MIEPISRGVLDPRLRGDDGRVFRNADRLVDASAGYLGLAIVQPGRAEIAGVKNNHWGSRA